MGEIFDKKSSGVYKCQDPDRDCLGRKLVHVGGLKRKFSL